MLQRRRNCSGRRARGLTADAALEPGYGVILVSTQEDLPRAFTFADDREEGGPLYSIPRGREVVLGGCNVTGHGGNRACR